MANKTKRGKIKTLDVVLAVVAILLVAFIVAMIVTFWKFQSVPDTLVVAVLGTGGSELVLSAIITIVKKKYGAD